MTHPHIISSTVPTYARHCHPWSCGQNLRSDCTVGQMDGEVGWWPPSRPIGLLQLARIMGRQWVDNNKSWLPGGKFKSAENKHTLDVAKKEVCASVLAAQESQLQEFTADLQS